MADAYLNQKNHLAMVGDDGEDNHFNISLGLLGRHAPASIGNFIIHAIFLIKGMLLCYP